MTRDVIADFWLAGVLVRFFSRESKSAEMVRGWLPDWQPTSEEPADIAIDLSPVRTLPRYRNGRQIFDVGGTNCWRDDSGLFTATDWIVGHLSNDRDYIHVSWIDKHESLISTGLNRCLRPLMATALARHGLHPLHASSVAFNDQVIVVLGPSGSGKSTLAGRMADLGAAFMSDDTSFVTGDEPKVVGLRDDNRPRLPGSSAANNAFRSQIRWICERRLLPVQRVLVLARSSQAEASVCPMRSEDLMTSLVLSGVFGMDPRSDYDRLQALSKLASNASGLLVTLGERHPDDETVLGWMEGEAAS